MKQDILARTRHVIDITKQEEEEPASKKLTKLVDFLDKVKDSARLRAKTEGDISFLHTRTGTFFGRWIKRLTVAWPAAQQQRQLARELVKGVLDNLNSSDAVIQRLKSEILDKTLEFKVDKEFDIAELRNQLKSLRSLLQSKSEEAAAVDRPSGGQQDAHAAIVSVSSQVGMPANRSDNAPISAESVVTLSKSVQTAQAAQNNNASQAFLHAAHLPDTEALPNSAPINSTTSADTNEAPVTDAHKNVQKIGAEPSTKSTFGCLQLSAGLSASEVHVIQDYHADAYILSSGSNDLKFSLGDTYFNPPTDFSNDNRIDFFKGTHTFYDEKRDIRKLKLQAPSGGPFTLLSQKDRTRRLNELHQLYTEALTLAYQDGAKHIALEPVRRAWRTPIAQEEMQKLANVIQEFLQEHSDVKIHVVLIHSTELQHFNTAIGAQ